MYGPNTYPRQNWEIYATRAEYPTPRQTSYSRQNWKNVSNADRISKASDSVFEIELFAQGELNTQTVRLRIRDRILCTKRVSRMHFKKNLATSSAGQCVGSLVQKKQVSARNCRRNSSALERQLVGCLLHDKFGEDLEACRKGLETVHGGLLRL